MTDVKWTRIAGYGALLALTLQGAGALALQLSPTDHLGALPGLTLWDCGDSLHFEQVLLLQVDDLPSGAPSRLVPLGWVAVESASPAAKTLPRLHPSRGPPA